MQLSPLGGELLAVEQLPDRAPSGPARQDRLLLDCRRPRIRTQLQQQP
jgi:hypothetical protein